ncbi:MAG: hypothetical protein ACK55W_09725 [Pseudomonadota bacterium]
MVRWRAAVVMVETFGQYTIRLRALIRFLVVRRQLAEVRRRIDALSGADLRSVVTQVSRDLQVPERGVTTARSTDAAFSRVRAVSARVRVLGIAQWLVAAIHETAPSPHAELQDLHRQVLRTVRRLRESGGLANGTT